LNIRQLKYFVQIVDLGSVSRAAESLHIAQSALSHQMGLLEASLEVELLNRTSRGISATEAGSRLYQRARAILQQVDDTKNAVRGSDAIASGAVSIGLPLSLAQAFALPIYTAVLERYPQVTLQMHETLSGTTLEWVKNGRLNIGLAFDEDNLQGLNSRALLQEELFLMVNRHSVLAKRKSLPLKDLRSISLVLPGIDQGVRAQVEKALVLQGGALQIKRVHANSLILMKQAAIAGLGATILSWPSAMDELKRRELIAIRIVKPSLHRVAAICVSGTLAQSVATKCVLHLVIEVIKNTVEREKWLGVRFCDDDSQSAQRLDGRVC
jgi:LysR family transcriptional regulator, nitrogen assimilation regulatory protein